MADNLFQSADAIVKAIDRQTKKITVNNELTEQVADIAERTDGLSVVKAAYSGTNVDTITFDITEKHYCILMYAGHMTSIVNSATSHTTIYKGGDDPGDYDFTLSKSGDTYTLSRDNHSAFLYAYIIL